MGLDKVGPELADRVLDKFGGVPGEWTVTVEELMEVPGIGRKKAEAMMGAFGLQTSSPTLKLIRGHDPDHPSVR
jgi:ERCC4-type nuclease